MKKLKLNPEFFRRHFAVCLLMVGLGCWFGYDGLVSYPKTPAAELYEKIEKAKAPDGYPLEAFKRQKIKSQYGFAALCLVAAALIGINISAAAFFRFEYRRYGREIPHDEIRVQSVDDTQQFPVLRREQGKLQLRNKRRLGKFHHSKTRRDLRQRNNFFSRKRR